MDAQKVDMFLLTNGKMLPIAAQLIIREKLLALDESKWMLVSSVPFKDPTTALILSLFFGSLGIDRFYIGDSGLGFGKLLTCGGVGFWTIVDWFNIKRATQEKNYEKLLQVIL